MQPEEFGNTVRLGDTFIPAVNIQVDGMPGVIEHVTYGVYFEIMFEDGSLWIVCGDTTDPRWVSVMEYPKWAATKLQGSCVGTTLPTWEEFLDMYKQKRQLMTI